MCIGTHCNRNVVTASRDTTVLAAAHLMRHNHVADVVIVDEVEGGRRSIGPITDRDIVVEIVSTGLDPSAIALGDSPLAPLLTVRTCRPRRNDPCDGGARRASHARRG